MKKEFVEPLIVRTKALSEFHGPLYLGNYLWFGGRVADPSTTGWGVPQAGYFWFNATEKKLKFWNGTVIKEVATV